MSSNLFRMIGSFFKGLNVSPNHVTTGELYVRSSLFVGCMIGHAIYAYGTNHTEDINVAKKYKMVIRGSTQFMIIDDTGRHFNVNNSLWYWKWNSVEDWARINKGGEYLKVTYYGIRSPLLGLFPNIVRYK